MQKSNRSKSSSQPSQRGGDSQKKSKSSGKAKPKARKQAAAAAAYATGQIGKAPTIMYSRETCRIRHRELIAGVTGSVNFTVGSTFSLNPGLNVTFPWLSTIAQSWEQYRFHKLDFCYYTRTGTGVPGSVLMSPDYDAAEAAPSSEQIASAYQDSTEDAPWKDQCCRLRPSSMHRTQDRHFVRNGPLAANLDIKTYDVGNLHVCTVDGTAVTWGKLWVEYDVEFFVPQLPPTGVNSLVGGRVLGGGSLSAANPFGTVPVPDAQLAGVSMSNASVLTFSLAGTYLVSAYYTGTGLSAVTTPVMGAGAAIVANVSVPNAASTAAAAWYTVTVTDPSTATMALAATASTIASSTVVIATCPTGSIN